MIKIRKNVFETNSSSSHSLVYQAEGNLTTSPNHKRNYDVNLWKFYGDDPERGILALSFGNYGWEGNPCRDFRSKLSYLLTQLANGYNFTYYGNCYNEKGERISGEKSVDIKTQEDWDKVIDSFILKNPKINRTLDFIKLKCPKIKDFKFCWFDTHQMTELEDSYSEFKDYYSIKNTFDIPPLDMNDGFFKNFIWGDREHMVPGLGYCDHQSEGLLDVLFIDSTDDMLDNYLFNDDLWVIITNDNF